MLKEIHTFAEFLEEEASLPPPPPPPPILDNFWRSWPSSKVFDIPRAQNINNFLLRQKLFVESLFITNQILKRAGLEWLWIWSCR